MAKDNLLHIQHWMNSIIVTPGNMKQKVHTTAHYYQRLPQETVVDSRGVNAISRLKVYANGYIARLLECLRADYPLLQQLMTEAVFNEFGRAYLTYKQSTSYTLFDLGADFPQFLLDSRPSTIPQEQAVYFDLPYNLALYERAFLEVFRAKGLEEKEAGLDENIPPMGGFFEQEKIQATPCLRCLKLDLSILPIVRQLHKKEPIINPNYQTTYLAICRQNYRIIPREIEAWQYHFLESIKTAKAPYEAAQISAQQSGKALEEILAEMLFFLLEAKGEGWVEIK